MDNTILQVTRDELLSGAVQRAAAQTPGMVVLSDADLYASLRSTLASHPEKKDIWIFGYGSLIWNPAFHFNAKRIGKVYGWHRRFCLWTSLSRGCPQQPGLILGLDRGGTCSGVAYRIRASDVEEELQVLWRREMCDGSYIPRWVDVFTDEGRIRAVTFTMNRSHNRYAGKLMQAEVVRVISTAHGRMGRCSDYLFNTVTSLTKMGIVDHKLAELERQVQYLLTKENELNS